MVVRDEAASIAETIESLRRLAPVARIVVLDTGSTDGTPDIARKAGAKVGELTWPESGRYDDAYNAMLARLEELVVDGDEWIFHAYGRRLYEGTWSPPPGAVAVSSTEYWSESCHATRVVAYRAGLHLRYRGATHEVLSRPEGLPVPDSGVRMRRHECTHPRPDRWARDLALLEGEHDARSRFYYAQTLACLAGAAHEAGDHERRNFLAHQAYAAYLARADLKGEGDDQEVAVSLFRAITMMPRHPSMLSAATRMCHGALVVDERRGEPWMALAEFCMAVGEPRRARMYAELARCATPDPRCLFLDPTVPARAERLLAAIP